MTDPVLGVGILGHGFMGRAHSYALNALRVVTQPAPLIPRLVSMSGRDQAKVDAARLRYGWEEGHVGWQRQVDDERIELFDNTAPNDIHHAPTLGALRNGKHVLCEKPLAPTAEQAFELWTTAQRARVAQMCSFNYRFFPAIQRARRLIDDGVIGDVQQFRSRFLVSTGLAARATPGWRTTSPTAAGGVLRDLGSHHIDLARVLVGEPEEVSASIERSAATVESAFQAIVGFTGGATGYLEASAVAPGHLCTSEIEVSGTRGWLRFALSRLNELQVSRGGGAQTLYVTDPDDAFMRWWYPPGHGLSWGDSFIHELDRLLRAIAGECTVGPIGATFEDGYRCAEICSAIERSASSRRPVSVVYRSPAADATGAGAPSNDV